MSEIIIPTPIDKWAGTEVAGMTHPMMVYPSCGKTGKAKDWYAKRDGMVIANAIGWNVPPDSYSTPQQRLDGRWVIPHPAPQYDAWQEIMGMCDNYDVAEYDPAWFPAPDPTVP